MSETVHDHAAELMLNAARDVQPHAIEEHLGDYNGGGPIDAMTVVEISELVSTASVAIEWPEVSDAGTVQVGGAVGRLVDALTAEVERLRALADLARTWREVRADRTASGGAYLRACRALAEAVEALESGGQMPDRSPRVFDREPPADVTVVYDVDGDEWQRTEGGWTCGNEENVAFPDLRDSYGPITARPSGGA
jgi:hypothetical protein